ncbi:uncharacterized protein G2W53_015917 [Senna tora]|uniref:Uncharacterized protein n=1 Tax=Senna tora TaxID=362788 RepID=A0A834WWF9_9FABA|nr:uncharacterized protein G2W53_015917 [Senna tora]
MAKFEGVGGFGGLKRNRKE